MKPVTRSPRGIVFVLSLVVSVALGPAIVFEVPGSAQTTQRRISIEVQPEGQIPAGVTGYTVDVECTKLVGAAASTDIAVAQARMAANGGAADVFFAVGVGSSCKFRLTVLGTGPRRLSASTAFVGTTPVAVVLPTTVGGQAVEVGTVVELGPVPVEAELTVRFGSPPVPTTTSTPTTTRAPTTTSTISTSTISTSTTSTTRPAPTASTTTGPRLTPTTQAPTRLVCRINTRTSSSGRKVKVRVCRRP